MDLLNLCPIHFELRDVGGAAQTNSASIACSSELLLVMRDGEMKSAANIYIYIYIFNANCSDIAIFRATWIAHYGDERNSFSQSELICTVTKLASRHYIDLLTTVFMPFFLTRHPVGASNGQALSRYHDPSSWGKSRKAD